MGFGGCLHCWERVSGAIAGLVGVTRQPVVIEVGGALIISVVAGLAGLVGRYHAQTLAAGG